LFWEDNWVGSEALKIVFPRLSSLSLSKASAVVAFGGWNPESWIGILSEEGIYLNGRSN